MANPSFITRFVLSAIRRYQRRGGSIKHFATSCNFTPTCSHYTYQAVERFGLFKGLYLGAGRIKRCNNPDCVVIHPDPIPEK
ncbi:MAG: membrane protein insertion efficiency factor YidD [Colwellia sp.]|nr:membrane protein insertion efficiency factor YidD [Colwellia sp.]MCW9081258.1 membrane protein insertion efficiency factor YidD [Colwellia sp.]